MDKSSGGRSPPRKNVARRQGRIAGICHLLDAPMDWLGGTERRGRALGRAGSCPVEACDTNLRIVAVCRKWTWQEIVSRRREGGG